MRDATTLLVLTSTSLVVAPLDLGEHVVRSSSTSAPTTKAIKATTDADKDDEIDALSEAMSSLDFEVWFRLGWLSTDNIFVQPFAVRPPSPLPRFVAPAQVHDSASSIESKTLVALTRPFVVNKATSPATLVFMAECAALLSTRVAAVRCRRWFCLICDL